MREARSRAHGHTPPLSNIWIAVVATVLLVALAIGSVYQVLQGLHPMVPGSSKKVMPASSVDVMKATIAIVALVGAALGGLYAYRKQRLAEGDARRSDADQFATRYTSAADQLGHKAPSARLAGVYAMARLADDWHEQRQQCIEVLCAYLRLPYNVGQDAAEREVRRTILRVIRDHLRPDRGVPSWQTNNFSFQGAVFEEGDLSRAVFSGGHVSFHGAQFVSDTFYFTGAVFTGASVWFTKARFSGAIVDFSAASFETGLVTFDGAEQTGGVVKFGDAHYDRTEMRWGSLSVPPDAPVPPTP
jgi:hypothetical protein